MPMLLVLANSHKSGLVYRDLHAKSYGNAIGVGHAEFVRSQLVRKINKAATRLNSLTAGMPTLAAVPVHFETDREILDAALNLIGLTPPEKAKVIWIRNTTALREMECSEAYLDEARQREDLSVLSGLHHLEFDSHGNLRNFVVGDPEITRKGVTLRDFYPIAHSK